MAERVIYKCAKSGTFYTTKDDNNKDIFLMILILK